MGFPCTQRSSVPTVEYNNFVWLKYLSDDVNYWVDTNVSLYLSFKSVGLIIIILILNKDMEALTLRSFTDMGG